MLVKHFILEKKQKKTSDINANANLRTKKNSGKIIFSSSKRMVSNSTSYITFFSLSRSSLLTRAHI
jgi:hypothetical protein